MLSKVYGDYFERLSERHIIIIRGIKVQQNKN